MSATWGWALAVAALVLGGVQWGWPGVALAVSVIVFWLLLQFSRALRVMRQATGAPVGHVASAVMLHAKLRTGMRLMEIIPLTRSLGQAVPGESPAQPGATEAFTWTDGSGAAVRVELVAGRLRRWELQRPTQAAEAPGATASAAQAGLPEQGLAQHRADA